MWSRTLSSLFAVCLWWGATVFVHPFHAGLQRWLFTTQTHCPTLFCIKSICHCRTDVTLYRTISMEKVAAAAWTLIFVLQCTFVVGQRQRLILAADYSIGFGGGVIRQTTFFCITPLCGLIRVAFRMRGTTTFAAKSITFAEDSGDM